MTALPGGPDVMTIWGKAEVIAEAVGGVGIVFTLFYSVWSFRTTLRDSYYAELDRVYFDLLKIGLDDPDLMDFPTSRDPRKAREYDAYAFMVWNFIETIFDRCQGWSKRRLRETWYPIIAAENARHRDWFERPQNREKFKTPFCRFIDEHYPMPRSVTPSSPAEAVDPTATTQHAHSRHP
jgi:hypothetical protein